MRTIVMLTALAMLAACGPKPHHGGCPECDKAVSAGKAYKKAMKECPHKKKDCHCNKPGRK